MPALSLSFSMSVTSCCVYFFSFLRASANAAGVNVCVNKKNKVMLHPVKFLKLEWANFLLT